MKAVLQKINGQTRKTLKEYEGIEIGNYIYCCYYDVHYLGNSENPKIDILIKEIQMQHIITGSEYKSIYEIDFETLQQLKDKIEAWEWNCSDYTCWPQPKTNPYFSANIPFELQ